jgi:hypothetical protein
MILVPEIERACNGGVYKKLGHVDCLSYDTGAQTEEMDAQVSKMILLRFLLVESLHQPSLICTYHYRSSKISKQNILANSEILESIDP